jgi:cytidine deaminase
MSPYENVLCDRVRYGNSFDYSYVVDDVSMNDWNKLLRTASLAKSSTHRFRIAATVVKGRKPISRSVNRYKSHPFVPPRRFSLHAEVAALMNVTDPNGATLYVARLDSENRLAPAKPCVFCVSYMRDLGIDRVVYSVSPNSCESFHLTMVTSKLFVEP